MTSSADPFNLTGRRAIVTGASRGIGLAIAQGFARRGASVVITGRKADSLAAAAQQLLDDGVRVQPMVCHQGDPTAIAALFEQLDGTGQPADIVVINAATNPAMGTLLETELGVWQKILDVNVTGALVTAQHAIRRMLPKKRGSLIFIASIAGIDPMTRIAAYSVSKAALLGLSRSLAKELGPTGIRVNAIAPGLVETRFAAALFQDQQAYRSIIANIPLGRHGQPEDIVGTAIFLASDASAYLTGQVLVVDGGSRM
jgi:NAD(P)-dependent dehydrogenase (short-subunit alcohol dehydrogenase family)